LNESLDALQVHQDGRYLDATAGHGGHAEAVARGLGPGGLLLALDRDEEAVRFTRERLEVFGDQVRVCRSSFGRMTEQAHNAGLGPRSFDGILMDLGIGSHQLDDPDRGFSFAKDGPLDMRYNRASGRTAADLINTLDERDLAQLIRELGEERHARRIARAIVQRRASAPFRRTEELAAVVSKAAGGRRGAKIHPATRTFQALRIATNGELDEVRAALPQAVNLLRPGGRLAVITFQSIETRMWREFLREQMNPCVCPPDLGICACGLKPTLKLWRKKAIVPSAQEVNRNPRSRSAQLRVAVRLDDTGGAVLKR
jgi:16S rRNA (cytosine1402-N4)-methyltransferase